MVAPTGVSEGVPQDPAEAAAAGVEPTGATAAGVEPAEADATEAEAEPAQSKPTASEPAEAKPAADETGQAEPALDETADTGPAPGDGAAAAEPTGGELARAGTDGPAEDAAEGSRDLSPLALAGIILVVLVLVGVAVGVLDTVTHGFRPKTVVMYRPAAVFGLRPGECINSGASALDVTVVSCSTPHDAEVFATFSLPQTGWPGASVAQLDASDGCVNRLDGYLNPQLATADLTQEYVYPNEAAWQAGEHTVVCEVRAVSGQLTGSVRAQS
jgi:Septum formation